MRALEFLPFTVFALALATPSVQAQTTERLSLAPSGESNGVSYSPELSADGRFVVWESRASNLASGDNNNTLDVFLLDRQSGTTELVSRGTSGDSAAAASQDANISDNGRYIAFRSLAPDIVPGQVGGMFIYDRVSQTYSCASANPFHTNPVCDEPSFSTDGRYLVFTTNRGLSAGDTNGTWKDVYRYDQTTGTLDLVSVSPSGVQSTRDCLEPSVSHDGRYVVFDSWSQSWGSQYAGQSQVWLKDMQTGALQCVSTEPDGTPGNSVSGDAHLSADGKWVAFGTAATNLTNISGSLQAVAKFLPTGELHAVTVNDAGQPGNNYSYDPRVSADGRFVLFRSSASNFHMGGTNAFYSLYVRDLSLQTTRKVSLTSTGLSNDDGCYVGDVSATGRHVVFWSISNNLVPGDTNGHADIFIRDRFGDQTFTYGWSTEASTGCIPHIQATGTPSVSAGSGFDIDLPNVRGAVPGILIYSKSGPATIPVFGSNLYLASPTVRTAVQFSGGTVGQCDGNFSLDFNALVATGTDAGLIAGTRVWAQYWSRDIGSVSGSHLSDAVTFVLGA